ncbi:MAG: EAL domain-containing protein [Betaproteobacteria bacterium]|nr:EAL domain-containing protein [Betaproteobacteria bacterium]
MATAQDENTGDPDLSGFGENAAARLKEALEKDEFTLYCQPIAALDGPERFPLGEVLVRMREEEKAMLPPGEFLPVFEHFRMMPQLDRWVVRHLARRLAKGSRIPCFTMNVSTQTLADAQFPPFVREELKAAGVAVDSLVFEIDEPDVLQNADLVARFVAAMKVVGAGVLIDGFGHKSVSFTPLRTVGAHFVKVDGSIVRKILTSELARTKLDAILRVAKSINLGVIAECVEEQEIFVRLKTLGVGYAQGFGIVQPQPIDKIAG